jgi:TonB family protein
MIRSITPAVVLLSMVSLLIGCGRADDGTIRLGARDTTPASGTADQPPVAINAVTPMVYPSALLEQGIEGRVLLRLYADSMGAIVHDSSRIAESSGYPALDSAALNGAATLRFSPALRHGHAVAGPFLQPVHFRNPRNRSAAQ